MWNFRVIDSQSDISWGYMLKSYLNILHQISKYQWSPGRHVIQSDLVRIAPGTSTILLGTHHQSEEFSTATPTAHLIWISLQIQIQIQEWGWRFEIWAYASPADDRNECHGRRFHRSLLWSLSGIFRIQCRWDGSLTCSKLSFQRRPDLKLWPLFA